MVNDHETDQLYACNSCDLTFKYLNVLKQHKHDHHGDKYCRQIGKKFDSDDQEIQNIIITGDDSDFLVEEVLLINRK